MDIHLTPDQESFIRQAIESGRLQSTEDAIVEALSMWEERERRRSEILASVERAETSLRHGRGRAITPESMRQLAEDVKARGRAALDIEKPPR